MRNQKSFGHIVEQCTENSRNARVALFVALSSARYWETTMQVKIPEQCSVRENWFSFISSARRLRFHLQHDKDQKVVFLKKRKKKIKKEKWLCFFLWNGCVTIILYYSCVIIDVFYQQCFCCLFVSNKRWSIWISDRQNVLSICFDEKI